MSAPTPQPSPPNLPQPKEPRRPPVRYHLGIQLPRPFYVMFQNLEHVRPVQPKLHLLVMASAIVPVLYLPYGFRVIVVDGLFLIR